MSHRAADASALVRGVATLADVLRVGARAAASSPPPPSLPPPPPTAAATAGAPPPASPALESLAHDAADAAASTVIRAGVAAVPGLSSCLGEATHVDLNVSACEKFWDGAVQDLSRGLGERLQEVRCTSSREPLRSGSRVQSAPKLSTKKYD